MRNPGQEVEVNKKRDFFYSNRSSILLDTLVLFVTQIYLVRMTAKIKDGLHIVGMHTWLDIFSYLINPVPVSSILIVKEAFID